MNFRRHPITVDRRGPRTTAAPAAWRALAAAAAAVAAAALVALAGCAGPPPTDAQPAAQSEPVVTLDADLLYDLLVADIAAQRGRGATAVEAALRAAYRSRDRRIVGAAVRLAARVNDHARVIELARLMASIAPRDFRNQLILADAQLKTGQVAAALTVLVEVARRQPADQNGAGALHSIAELLAESAQSAQSAAPDPAQSPPQILQQFRAAAAPWRSSAPLQFTAAQLALKLQRGEDFQRLIDQTLRLRPRWQAAAVAKLDYLSVRFPVQAGRFAAVFLRGFPAAHRFRIRYGGLLLDAGRPAQAAAQLEAVLRQDPQSSEALFAAAAARFEMAEYGAALQRMRRYLALNPRNDRARLFIADIHFELAEFAAAEEALREVASPAYRLDAQVALATVLAKRHGVDAGIRHLRQTAVRGSEDAVRVVLEQARLYHDYAAPARAKTALDDGLARFPAHPDLLYQRGLLAAQLDLLDLHERDMRQLIALQPHNAHAYNALGYTLADQTERLDEAFKLISKALKLRPNDPFILDSMGWAHFRRGGPGDNARAIAYLRRALAVREDAEIAAHLGEALWVAGRKREAREIWAKGKAWSPDNATLLDTLRRFSGQKSSAIERRPAGAFAAAAILISAPIPAAVR